MKYQRGYYDIFIKTCGLYPSKVAMRVHELDTYKCYTYSELYGACEYIAQTLQQFHCNRSVIGLVSKRNVLVPCIVAAAHKCSDSFMFLDPSQDIDVIADDMKFSMVVSILPKEVQTMAEVLCRKPDKIIRVFDFAISFYNYSTPSQQFYKQIGYSFIAMTSGSTGDPKKVQVPINCIQPNIIDLTKLFNITPADVIYFSTPLTFDPSMIEILLACMNGASLLIAPAEVDILLPDRKSLKEHAVTVWQTTPSKFFQLSNASISKALSSKSPLKILALGGEPLTSVRRMRMLKDKDNKTKLFTLYGVTEMSCWACAAELDLNKIDDKEVPLGNCLSETEIMLKPKDSTSGKIILVSKTRNCVILNRKTQGDEANSLKFVDTGDIGEMKNGTIYYRGRTDDTVKRFGYKINLQFIENTVMHCPRVKACSCIWLPKPRLLVVYFSSDTFSSQDMSDYLKCKLDDKHWPDKIIRVANLPINNHGKITRAVVKKFFDKHMEGPLTLNNIKARFLLELRSHLNRNVAYEDIKDNDFFSIGGTSFLAVSLCNKLALTDPNFGRFLLPHLMSPMKTIDQVLELVALELAENKDPVERQERQERPKEQRVAKRQASVSSKSESESKRSMHSFNPLQIILLWSYNTNKCVDASPTLLRTDLNLYVCVGSHSGKVVAIDVMSGLVQCVVRLKSRVEAAVMCYNKDPAQMPIAIVGAYDGTIICFTVETGEERWRTNVGCMIKSKAAACHGLVYVASYDGVIRALDIKTGVVKFSITISDQPISADLVLAKNEYVLTGTLAGVIASINTTTHVVVWRASVSGPVFASPALYDNDKYVVFAEVNGEIHCRTVEKGIKIWSFSGVKGNVFSSFCIKETAKQKWQLVFGCHDHNLYSLTIKNYQPTLKWRTLLSSPIYSTPCTLSNKFVLAACNNGQLCIISFDTGAMALEYHLPNETFSSPATYDDYIFIGCRNDNLYALKYIS